MRRYSTARNMNYSKSCSIKFHWRYVLQIHVCMFMLLVLILSHLSVQSHWYIAKNRMSHATDIVNWVESHFEEESDEFVTFKTISAQWPEQKHSKKKIASILKGVFPRIKSSVKRIGNDTLKVYIGLRHHDSSKENNDPLLNLDGISKVALEENIAVIKKSDRHLILGVVGTVCGKRILKEFSISVEGQISLSICNNFVDLNTISVSNYTDFRRNSIRSLFKIMKEIKLCQGYQSDEEVDNCQALQEQWVDQGSICRLYRSSKCQQILSFTMKGSMCLTCQRQLTRIKLKQKEETAPESTNALLCLNSGDDTSISEIFQQLLPDLKAMPGLELLLQSQVDNLKRKDKRQRRWDPKIIQLCLTLWSRSPKAYADLRESGYLVLPSGSVLSLYKNAIQQTPGFNDNIFKWMRAEFKRTGQPDTGTEGGILFDEMAIQADLQITPVNGVDSLVGFVDLGDEANYMKIIEKGKSEKILATHVLQMIFLGDEGFRFPFCHFPTHECEGAIIWRKFWHSVQTLRDWSFKVNFVSMDGAVQNRTFMKSHFSQKSLSESLYTAKNLFRPQEKMIFIMDPSHTMKKIRNNLLKSKEQTGAKRILTVDGHMILWSHWVKAWEWDQANNSMSIYHKLTWNHLFPDSNLKMRNKLAFQVLNSDMLYLMKSYQESIGDDEAKKLTASIKLLEKTSTMVEVFSDMRPITTSDDRRLHDLQDSLTWFEEWEKEVMKNESGLQVVENKKKLMSDQTREDLASSIIGLKQLVILKEASPQGGYVVPGRLNTDIVENLFCQQRGLHNGATTNPNYLTYSHTMNSILLGQSTVSRKGNVGKPSEPFNFHSDQPLRKRRCLMPRL